MRRIEIGLATAAICAGQVLSPPEILDPEIRELQQRHFTELKSMAVAISSHQFPYHFYFSRKLDVTEEQERLTDQRSIQFARFQNQIVLQITGNYFAAYSADLMKKEDRVRRTFEDVMLPILSVAAPAFGQEKSIQKFALEISHHVRKKTIGVTGERAENVVLAIPREAALRLVSEASPAAREAALQEASLYLDGESLALWGRPEPTPVAVVAPKPEPAPPPPAAAVDTSPVALRNLQASWQDTLDRIVRDLNAPARFVGYAPPVFIPFHKNVYLQFSLTTPLPASAGSSRYRLAALAFDDHIATLIRPLLAFFKEDPNFGGIDFSTSIRQEGAESGAVAVEYIFGMPSLRCYEQYDCTGQQLINSGFVLINGERVSLDLQKAE
jgi:hypothetical protein